MARLSLLLFFVFTLAAADRWVGLRSGPFEVLSDAGDRTARERLADLEQFRGAVEQVLGKSDIRPVWPIRVLVLRSTKQAPPGLARDAYIGAVPSQGPLPPAVLRECARILIESGPRGLSPAMERGLAEVFSTLEIDGSSVTLGAPLPPAERNLDWARMHMLTVLPDYYGKLPVAVHNLEQGVEAEPALRNAFGKSPAQIDKEAEAYLRAGQFAATPLRGIVLRPAKDFTAMPVPMGAERVALADLSLANPAQATAARQAYQAILASAPGSAEALEGLGLLALRDKRVDEARNLLDQAIAASTTSARAFLEYARLETDRDKKQAAFEKAAQLNPRWALPPFELAQMQTGLGRRISLLAAAAKLEPRNVAYWRALAGAQEDANQLVDAAKSWASAELAAGTPEERARLRQIHDEAEVRRKQQEAEAKKREADEKQRELEALKQKSMASIQAALDKAQREHPALPPASGKVEAWWDGPRPDGKIQGVLTQVDCLGKRARLVVERKGAKPVRLLVSDPGKIVILGGGEKTFGCGPQKPPRNIAVEYFTKPDAKLGTAGEAAVIEFPRVKNPVPLRWMVLGVFVLSSALNYLDRQILAALAPVLRAEFSLTNAGYGMVLAAFSITYAISSPLAGLMIDRFGLNRAISAGVGLWSMAGVATGFARGLPGLLGCRAVLGAAESCGVPAVGKALHRYLLPGERALGNAFSQIGLSVGAIAAPPLAVWFALHYGWRSAFVFTGALGLAWIPLWLWASRKAAAVEDEEGPLPHGRGSETTSAYRAATVRERLHTSSSLRLLRDVRLWGFVAANILSMPVYTLWSNWTTLYLKDAQGATFVHANLLAPIPNFFAYAGGLAGGWLSLKWTRAGVPPLDARRKVCRVSALLLLATAAVPWMPGPGWATAAISVSFFAITAWSVNLYTMPLDAFGGRHAAFSVSLLTGAYGAMQAVISPLIGATIDKSGYGPVCIVAAILPLAAYGILSRTR